MEQLFTVWGETLDKEHVLDEYPRPLMVRDSYLNLNGYWDYAFTQEFVCPKEFDGKILVPFSPEAALSGVNRQLMPNEYLWYHRTFSVDGHKTKRAGESFSEEDPESGMGADLTEERLLLHFGAVDQACVVWVNGQRIGKHTGGYLPFEFEITEAVQAGENDLVVAVKDLSDTSYHSRGKQKLERGGMFYTAQSGIWQTVWLERVPEKYIKEVETLPEPDEEKVRIIVRSGAEYAVKIVLQKPKIHKELKKNVPDDPVEDMTGSRIADPVESTTETTIGTFYGKTNEWLEIPVQDVQMWTCDTPYLYDFTVEMEKDRVAGYFAMRKFTLEKDGQGFVRICLNHQVQYQNGVLDQGYWPEGLYTPPSDAAVERELSEVKALGYNLLRKHAKIEPQRWYYHCDKLGLVVWQDMVNGGSKYNLWFVTYLTNVLQPLMRRLPDKAALWGLLSRGSEASREEYRRELEDTVQALRCHPCVGCWVPFNEGWGQYDAAGAVQATRALDDTRLVDEASGWYDQGGGDVYSLHNYFYPLRVRPQTRTVALSEYGGIAWPMPGHEPPRKTYGYGTAKDRQELTARYKKLQLKTVLPQLEKGLSALVYTQLTDVEDEVNGLFTYDRAAVKPDANAVRSVNAALAAEFARVTNPAKK